MGSIGFGHGCSPNLLFYKVSCTLGKVARPNAIGFCTWTFRTSGFTYWSANGHPHYYYYYYYYYS